MQGSKSKSEPGVPKNHLKVLTGIRFLAALHVVIYHLWRYDVWRPPGIVLKAVAAGPVAVTLFFVLSGFILTYNYASDGASGSALNTSSWVFWRARFARIYPVYALGLLISLPIVLVLVKRAQGDVGIEMGKGAAAFLLVQSWWPSTSLAWNPPAWSISVEAFFYLIFPLISPFFLGASFKKAVGVAGVFWGLSMSLAMAYFVFDPDNLGANVTHRDHALWWEALKYHPLVRLPEFIIGMVAGRVLLRRRAESLESTSNQERSSSSKDLKVFALILLSMGIVLCGIPHVFLHNALLAPIFASLFVLLGSWPPPRIMRWLESRPLLLLGEASYALYILHVPLFYWIAGIGERRTGRKILEHPLNAFFALLFAVATSLLVFYVFERPLRSFLRAKREEP